MNDIDSPSGQPTVDADVGSGWVAYIAPMVVFAVFTALEGQFKLYYPAIYIAKIVTVAMALWIFRSNWKDIRPNKRVLIPALLVGIAIFLEWIMLGKLLAYPHFETFLGKRSAYNPFEAIANPVFRTVFLTFRFAGLVVLVPVMEELFWRSFVLRIVTNPDHFERVPIGTFSWAAFAVVAAAFGLSHPEWLEAVICAVAYGLLLKQTRSIYACVIAHGVTNLMLGVYVLTAHQWRFW